MTKWPTIVTVRVVLSISAALVPPGCARLGFTDRVLWRVPAPDGQVVAVCQEISALDGPNFEIRL